MLHIHFYYFLFTHRFNSYRYVIMKKLGWGHFSTVWMVRDRKKANTSNKFLALKVQKSAEHYTEAAMDEVELLDCIAKERKRYENALTASNDKDVSDSNGLTIQEIHEFSRHTATLYDSFFHNGPNGKHMCMVFEMLGCNLLSVIKASSFYDCPLHICCVIIYAFLQAFNYRGIPIPAVKNMVRGICMGLDFLHRKCKIIHTDLKPENVLLCFNPSCCSTGPETVSISVNSKKTSDTSVSPSNSKTIEDIEQELKNQYLSSDDRTRLQNQLRKKRQRKNRKEKTSLNRGNGHLTDDSIKGLLTLAPMSNQNSIPTSPNRVMNRLSHCAFLAENFSSEQHKNSEWTEILRNIDISCPDEIDILDIPDKVANITFLLRAFGPEGEVADNLSHSLGIKWEKRHDKRSSREW